MPDSRAYYDSVSEHLAATLMLAVPFAIRELGLDADRDYKITRWAKDAAQTLGAGGDALIFRSKKGRTANVFGHLVRGVAAAAYCPGGIRVCGVLFCHAHHPGGTERGPWPCADCHGPKPAGRGNG